ncbi:MAG: hypothetical protein ABJD11_06295 [Gemmatimonadota bacterium]
MRDIDDGLNARATRALEAYRHGYTRLLNLLDAQRAAFRAEDFGLLAGLAEEGTTILGTLERTSRFPSDLTVALGKADGPRAENLRQALGGLESDALAARTCLQNFMTTLVGRKSRTLRQLNELSVAGPGSSSPYGESITPPSRLDREG